MRLSIKITIIVLNLFFVTFAYADVIHLKNGNKIEGSIVKKTDRGISLRILGGAGEISIKYDDIKEIEKISDESYSYDVPLSSLELGTTTLDDMLAVLKDKNVTYELKNGGLYFTIKHKYKDYLDAPYTIVLSFKDVLFDNLAEYKLFFTPKSKVLYRVEICTDGEKDKFLRFFTGKYNRPPSYSDACYYWPSKPDPATNEVFYNVLFCPSGAYSPTITLFWTDWDYLYALAVMEGTEIRTY